MIMQIQCENFLSFNKYKVWVSWVIYVWKWWVRRSITIVLTAQYIAGQVLF